MHIFKVGDRVRVSDCCNGVIVEINYGTSAMVEVNDKNGNDIIYIELDDLQLIEDG